MDEGRLPTARTPERRPPHLRWALPVRGQALRQRLGDPTDPAGPPAFLDPRRSLRRAAIGLSPGRCTSHTGVEVGLRRRRDGRVEQTEHVSGPTMGIVFLPMDQNIGVAKHRTGASAPRERVDERGRWWA